NKDTNKNILNFIGLGITLLVTPMINILNNNYVQAIRVYSKKELWEKVSNEEYSYFLDSTIGKIQSYINEVSFACREIEQNSLLQMIKLFAMLFLYTIMLIKLNIMLGIIYLVIFVCYMILSTKMANINRMRIAQSLSKTSKINENMQDYYQNIEVILASNSQKFEDKKIDHTLNDEKEVYYHVQQVTNFNTLVQQFIVIALAAIICIFGMQYLAFRELSDRISSGLKVLKYDVNLKKKKENFVYNDSQNSIQLQNLSFKYSNKKKVFSNLSGSFPKAKMSAIIGENGRGKSTLLKIIMNFYPLRYGTIIFPYKDPLIVYIPQNAPLFNRSIYENISYPGKKISVDFIMKLVTEIGLDSLIKSKKDLKNKKPGDFKNSISGGERQKILFLRAIVSKPDILLLDEITSNLDEKTVTLLYRLIRKYLKNTTIIGITHRQEELKYYDYIFRL
ncbi:ATP-binding cassette domain-containing protein, partial [Lactobacillus helveticus]|uniref:ATP-binding cassette domain-containing protein n=1 Tax=Lactobacillus helveticus TaxID=1587 RepID=UPI00156285A5